MIERVKLNIYIYILFRLRTAQAQGLGQPEEIPLVPVVDQPVGQRTHFNRLFRVMLLKIGPTDAQMQVRQTDYL